MASLSTSLSVTGTELERPGGVPLVALEARQDGRLVSAVVVDPLELELEARVRDGRVVLHGDVRLDRELDMIFGTARVA